MDPTEALVFFLGGFSDDPVFPFSGKGGPLLIMNDGSPAVQVKSNHDPAHISSVQYNPDRLNPLYEFQQGQLTIELTTVRSLHPTTISFGAARRTLVWST